MSEFYKLSIADWNTGTDDLSLEQEGAYLRVVNAINLYDQPIRDNLRVLAGMWRCNERKAKRLRQELVDAGKIWIEDGFILNERAVEDVSTRRRLRVERASSGSRGGIESGKSRRKPLANKECGEASASTRIEENRREDKKEKPTASPKKGSRLPDDWALPRDWGEWALAQGMTREAIRAEAAKFADYWRSVPGQRGVKLDWEATWRNWCRKAIELRPTLTPINGGLNHGGQSARERRAERDLAADLAFADDLDRQRGRG